MGSHPTLDHRELAAEHPQVRSWPHDNPNVAHELDYRGSIYDHTPP